MGDLIQFVPRPRTSLPSERAQRMIAEARAQYQAIFPDEPTLAEQYADAAKAVNATAQSGMNPDNLA